MEFYAIVIVSLQPWPADLPLITVTAAEDGTEVEELDMGVVLYSCSFAVIFLMILSQVTQPHCRRIFYPFLLCPRYPFKLSPSGLKNLSFECTFCGRLWSRSSSTSSFRQ